MHLPSCPQVPLEKFNGSLSLIGIDEPSIYIRSTPTQLAVLFLLEFCKHNFLGTLNDLQKHMKSQGWKTDYDLSIFFSPTVATDGLIRVIFMARIDRPLSYFDQDSALADTAKKVLAAFAAAQA